jgi:hypothetical protein
VSDEVLVLVPGEGRRHRVDEQAVEVRPLDPVDEDLVQVRQLRRAEVVVLRDLEVVVGEAPVLASFSS